MVYRTRINNAASKAEMRRWKPIVGCQVVVAWHVHFKAQHSKYGKGLKLRIRSFVLFDRRRSYCLQARNPFLCRGMGREQF